ncbi:putative GntR-family transcriptional regulator [Carbonactinospora thermoautotrophica]|uniref:Putative GntR-family transcriptional regulator n=1 Tax=Carbonactinospora thermoautotrophica TaxID=1469144 RepID=A0A132MSL1_9ACTN|nr:putative GntR-family transcriptional regulator [Carbonactinospora thermoautotrophica]
MSEVHGVLSDAEGRPLEYGVSIAGGGRVLYSEERSLA